MDFPMLSESQGCMAGFHSGITIYEATEYDDPPGLHDVQEGFVVMEGRGWAKVGDEEFQLEPDVCFLAAAGVKHSMKRDPSSEYLKVCWTFDSK